MPSTPPQGGRQREEPRSRPGAEPGEGARAGQETRRRPPYLLRRLAAGDDLLVAVRAFQRRGRPGGAGRAHPPAAGAVGPHPVVRHAAFLLVVGRGLEARRGPRRLRAGRRIPAQRRRRRRGGLRAGRRIPAGQGPGPGQRLGLPAGQGPGQRRLRAGRGPPAGGERAVVLLAAVVVVLLLLLLVEVRGQREGLQLLLLAPVHAGRGPLGSRGSGAANAERSRGRTAISTCERAAPRAGHTFGWRAEPRGRLPLSGRAASRQRARR